MKLTSHGIYYAICGKRICQKAFLNWVCQYFSFLNICFNRFCLIEKCGVTSHCLYHDSSSLITSTTYLMCAILFYYRKLIYFLFCQFQVIAPWMCFLATMQSHWGFISSRRLFITFGSLTGISIKTRILVKTNSKPIECENWFEKNSFIFVRET